MAPRIAYVLCTTPRTGSGLLGEALWKSERAGRPDEYFSAATAAEYMAAWSIADPRRYLAAVVDYATTANGVFGVKMMASDVAAVARFVPGANPRDPHAALDALAAVVSPCRFVFLARRDRVRQAISLWKATQLGAFASGDDASSIDAESMLRTFRVRHVDRLVADIDRWNAEWQRYFTSRRLDPLPLVYEDDLADGHARGVAKVLAAIGVASGEAPLPPVGRRPQADVLSAELAARYRAARPDVG